MGLLYDLQKYTLSGKMIRIKVVGVMKDYLLVTLILNLILKSIWIQIQPAKAKSVADPAN